MMINREASDKTKGFRLQKIRVIEYMLDGILKYEKPLFYSAIEHLEDVYVKDRSDNGIELLEEDKNYDPESTFTFNSHQVVNTLVSFIDIWFKYCFSDNLKFSFYSTNKYTQEGISKVIKENQIVLPDKPILELLTEQNLDHASLLSSVKAFVIAEYKAQYNKPNHPGHIDFIENMDAEQWKKFLGCIDWKFGEVDEVNKKIEVLGKIKTCKHFSQAQTGLEETIFCQLMEIYDERQNLSDPTEKFVHSSDIELVFVKSCSQSNHLIVDPVWKIWSGIPQSDSRNIKDKIINVCADYSDRKIKQHALKVSRSLIEQSSFSTDKSLLSLKYRVFEHCSDYLVTYLENRKPIVDLSETEIDELLAKLNAEALIVINGLAVQYNYTHNNQKLIDGLILELFDSCYLAFD